MQHSCAAFQSATPRANQKMFHFPLQIHQAAQFQGRNEQ